MSATSKIKHQAIAAMLAAVAYVVVLIQVPSGFLPFLDYEAKDVIITIGGFMLGPLTALSISIVVSFIEMITISSTGPVGFIMNVLSTCAFACTAAIIYKKNHSMRGAFIGLIAGLSIMTITMMLWNFLITPLYMNVPRDAVVKMLIPAFLPFNLLKGALNMSLVILLYKPIVIALRKTHLLPSSISTSPAKRSINIAFMLLAALILISCIFILLIKTGVIVFPAT